MSEMIEWATVTIPALDIKQKEAFAVRKAPKRFSVWWDSEQDGRLCNHDTITRHDPDMNVPNEMIILEK
jgi:hypothetical protein